LLFSFASPSLFFPSSLCSCFKLFMTHCLPTLNSTYFTTISCLLHSSRLLCIPIYFIAYVCVLHCSYLFHHSCLFTSCSHLLALCFHILPWPLFWIATLIYLRQDSNFIFQVLAIAPTCFNAYMFKLWCLPTSSLCFYFIYPFPFV
jgi:hypothetical protein